MQMGCLTCASRAEAARAATSSAVVMAMLMFHRRSGVSDARPIAATAASPGPSCSASPPIAKRRSRLPKPLLQPLVPSCILPLPSLIPQLNAWVIQTIPELHYPVVQSLCQAMKSRGRVVAIAPSCSSSGLNQAGTT